MQSLFAFVETDVFLLFPFGFSYEPSLKKLFFRQLQQTCEYFKYLRYLQGLILNC